MAPSGMMNESLTSNKQTFNKYTKVNSLITDILCSQGSCPVW